MAGIESDILKSETKVLENLKCRVEQQFEEIGLYTRSSLELKTFQDQFFKNMTYRLGAEVLAEKLVDKTIHERLELSIYYPASWWQHFKQDVLNRFWATRWYVRRWPVRQVRDYKSKTVTANFKQYATFPAVDIVTPTSYHNGVIVAKEMLNVYNQEYPR